MVIFINLIPAALVAVCVIWGYRRWLKHKQPKAVLPSVLTCSILLLLYFQVQPSYMPKGEVKRTAVPAFEKKQLDIKDLQPKPVSGEERDEKRKQLYQEKLPFLDKDKPNASDESLKDETSP